MSKKPHELHESFPAYADALDALQAEDKHFAKLVAEYDEVNHKIFRAENNLDPMEDLAMIEMRKERGLLRDQIFAALKAAQPAD